MKEGKIQRVAAINIGSNNIEMLIAQVLPNGEYFILENVEKSISIGKSSFLEGKINADLISEISNILIKFSNLMKEYKVKTYKAVATTGIREADNRDYVIEQIRVRCGIIIDILNKSLLRYYKYKALDEELNGISKYYNKDYAIMDIESGSVYCKLFKRRELYKTSDLQIGTIRLLHKFSTVIKECDTYSNMIEEFINNKLFVYNRSEHDLKYKNLLITGTQIEIIKKFVKLDEDNSVSSEVFLKKYESIRNLSIDIIIEKYNISYSEAEILIVIASIIKCSLISLYSTKIKFSFITLNQGLLLDVIDENIETERKLIFEKNILDHANYIEKKYKGFIDRKRLVEKYALEIFNSTKSIHKLQDTDKLYLAIACRLRLIVPALGLIDDISLSYNIIEGEAIEGLSNDEMKIIANIVRYQNDLDPYDDLRMTSLKRIYRLKVAKLSAILRIAKALGVSGKDKYSSMNIKIEHSKLIIKVVSKEDCRLENFMLNEDKELFEEVMGYNIVFKNIVKYGDI